MDGSWEKARLSNISSEKAKGRHDPDAKCLPVAIPTLGALLEDLKQGRPHVVLGIKPGKIVVRVKGGLPHKALVGLQLHAKQGIRQTGEIVVVDSGVDKGARHIQRSNIFFHDGF